MIGILDLLFTMPQFSGSKLLLALVSLCLLVTSCSTSMPLANPHASPITQSADGNLVLMLNNESSSDQPIDFHVFIDGHPAYSGEIGSSPHHYLKLPFKVSKGSHVVYVNSQKADIWEAQSFKVGEKLWVYISYEYFLPLSREDFPAGGWGPNFQILDRLEQAQIH
jgi:hypothetical protein